MAHAHWIVDYWYNVVFSDEFRMCLRKLDGRMRVYRRIGEALLDSCVARTVQNHGGSCMFYAAINGHFKIALVPVAGSLKSPKYTQILKDCIAPICVDSDFIFMDDNAKPHRAKIVKEYKERVGMKCLDWPARSPDLNPIEHLWSHLKRQVAKQVTSHTKLSDLKHLLADEWDHIDHERIVKLIESMPRRIQAVVERRGGHPRY